MNQIYRRTIRVVSAAGIAAALTFSLGGPADAGTGTGVTTTTGGSGTESTTTTVAVTTTLAVTTTAAGGGGSGQLPRTGSDNTAPLAVALIGASGLAVVGARKLASSSAA